MATATYEKSDGSCGRVVGSPRAVQNAIAEWRTKDPNVRINVDPPVVNVPERPIGNQTHEAPLVAPRMFADDALASDSGTPMFNDPQWLSQSPNALYGGTGLLVSNVDNEEPLRMPSMLDSFDVHNQRPVANRSAVIDPTDDDDGEQPLTIPTMF